jgi:thiamine-monophosphate kinase
MTPTSVETLTDVGEFRLLQEVVIPALGSVSAPSAILSDAALLSMPPDGADLAVSTDAAPIPAGWHLGGRDYRTAGWYAVVVNASDLAACGATPFAGTTSVDAPGSMLVCELQEFFRGVREAYLALGVVSAGGNLRQATKFACHGTLFGAVPAGQGLTRSGGQAGDIVIAVGPSGRFGPAVLRALRGGWHSLSGEDRRTIDRPKPMIEALVRLRQEVDVHAASDASDGLLGALWNVASASACSVLLDEDAIDYSNDLLETARSEDIDPLNLFCLWGDWQVVIAVDPEDRDAAIAAAAPATVIGTLRPGPTRLDVSTSGVVRQARLVRNESFRPDAYASDFPAHLDYMLRTEIIKRPVR